MKLMAYGHIRGLEGISVNFCRSRIGEFFHM